MPALRLLLCCLFLLALPARAQRLESAVWMFGGTGLDFRASPPALVASPFEPDTGYNYDRSILATPAAICDSTGGLLLYVLGNSDNGVNSHAFDAQGRSIIETPLGIASFLSPMPGRPRNWYYITGGPDLIGTRFQFDSGRVKFVPLAGSGHSADYYYFWTAPLGYRETPSAMALHANGRDRWLIRPIRQAIRRVHVSLLDPSVAAQAESPAQLGNGVLLGTTFVSGLQQGISPMDTITEPWVLRDRYDTVPWVRSYVSPDSRRLCVAAPNALVLWRFDPATGRTYDSLIVPARKSHMACFSPNSRYLYCPSADTVFQLDLSVWQAGAVWQSRVAVGRLPACPSPSGCETPWATLSDAKVAVNGKIYALVSAWRARRSGGAGLERDWPKALAVIHCPDTRGVGCGFELSGQGLGGRRATTQLGAQDQTLVANAYRLQLMAGRRALCAGDTSRLYAFGAGAERFEWRLAQAPAGGQEATLLAATLGAQADFSARVPGRYTIAVRGHARCGYKDTSITIEVLGTPARTIADTLLCPPAASQLLRLSPDTARAGTAYRWRGLEGAPLWALSDTATPAARLTLPLADSLSHPMAYVLEAIEIASGCRLRDTVRLRLGPDVAAVRIAAPAAGCQGDTLRLAAAGGAASYAYSWSGAPGLATPGAKATRLVLADTGADAADTLTLLLATSREGCQARDTARLRAYPLPPRLSLSGPRWVCPGSPAVPYALSSAQSRQVGPWHYRVRAEGGDSAGLEPAPGPLPGAALRLAWQARPTDTAGLRLTVYGPQGCARASERLPVSVTRRLHPRFALTPGLSTEVCYAPGLRLPLSALDTVAGRRYGWRLGGLLPDSADGPMAAPFVPAAGRYLIRLFERETTSEAYCQGDTALEASICPAPPDSTLRLPNVCTPSQANARFTAPALRFYRPAALSVRDRWGRTVFESADYLDAWPGPATPAGTYFYLLALPGGQSRKGWVEVVR